MREEQKRFLDAGKGKVNHGLVEQHGKSKTRGRTKTKESIARNQGGLKTG